MDIDSIDTRDRLEDEWLAVRCQLGEPEAFNELIVRWQQPLWTYVRRVAGDDEAARDVMQDTWLRVVRGIARLRDGAKLRAWLFGIARRALMDRFRARYAAAPTADVDVTEIPATPPVVDESELQMLEHGIAQLPLVEREAVTLFYLEELSLAEVANTLNVPVGTIKSRLFRARQMLRRQLSAQERCP